MLTHKFFGLTQSNAQGQELTYRQLCFALNKTNAFQMVEIELPFSIAKCPRKNTQSWIKCKIKDIDKVVKDKFQEFGECPFLTEEQFHYIVPICNIYKFRER